MEESELLAEIIGGLLAISGALPEYGTLSDGVVFVDFFFFKTRYMKIRSDIGKTHMPRPV